MGSISISTSIHLLLIVSENYQKLIQLFFGVFDVSAFSYHFSCSPKSSRGEVKRQHSWGIFQSDYSYRTVLINFDASF